MLMIGKPDDDAADEGTGKLTKDVEDGLAGSYFADGKETDGYSRVNVRAGVSGNGIDADDDGHGPTGRDDDPTGVLSFRLT